MKRIFLSAVMLLMLSLILNAQIKTSRQYTPIDLDIKIKRCVVSGTQGYIDLVFTNHTGAFIKDVKVEIQIRTMPQEMWAILEERLCYQKQVNKSIIDNLKRLSNVIADVDYNMNEMIKYSRQQQKQENKKKKVLSY